MSPSTAVLLLTRFVLEYFSSGNVGTLVILRTPRFFIFFFMGPFLIEEEEEALPLTGRLLAAPPRGDVLNDDDCRGAEDDFVCQGRRNPTPFNCEGEASVVPMEAIAIAMAIVMAIVACRREVMVAVCGRRQS